jgi:hypothetical protein
MNYSPTKVNIFARILVLLLASVSFIILFPLSAFASPLAIATDTHVSDEGQVRILLSLRNSGREALLEVHPMFHFHHAQSMMPKIMRLEPGQSITLENTRHPDVVLTGRYPLHVMVSFHQGESEPETQLHTDSFYFREPVISMVEGEIETSSSRNESLVKVLLTNNSSAMKNIRLMLILPSGLQAENFGGMMGLTMRGGEEKSFTIPVKRISGGGDGAYPVHLMIEYGEMLKHYTNEIHGKIWFHSIMTTETFLPHLMVLSLLGILIFLAYRKKKALP